MTLAEAVQTGKKFKRVWWNQYFSPGSAVYLLNTGDILATDWEVEEDHKFCPTCEQEIELAKEPIDE